MSQEKNYLSENPFAQLFPSLEEAHKFSQEVAPKLVAEIINQNSRISSELDANTSKTNQYHCISTSQKKEEKVESSKKLTKDERINNLVEMIFGITADKNSDKQLIYLNELPVNDKTPNLVSASVLEQALFERLLLENPIESLINRTNDENVVDRHVVQTEVVSYLFEAYKKVNNFIDLNENSDIKEELSRMKNLIIRNVSTSLLQPQLYENQDLASQLLEIFYDVENSVNNNLPSFLDGIVTEMSKEESYQTLCNVFKPILDLVHKKIANSNIVTFESCSIFSFLQTMASNKILGEILIDHSTPQGQIRGNCFADTLFGAIFCLSCLPKTDEGNYEFFEKPAQTASTMEGTLWTSLSCIGDCLHQLFLSLLKLSPVTKHKTLKWFALCLHTNAARGKLSNSHGDPNFGDLGISCVSDGFMLNLGGVLLRLCQPFILQVGSSKILKIDPTYCAAECKTDEERMRRNHHMYELHKETCFLPSENEERPASETFNFMTECFFLAQKCMDLGFRVCVEKLARLYQDLARLQRGYTNFEILEGANSELTLGMRDQLEAEMTKYLSLKAAVTEPKSLDLTARLHVTSSDWLIQILLETDNSPRKSYILNSRRQLQFPLPERVPETLTCLPEFVIENLVHFLFFIKGYYSSTLEENGSEFLETILSCITVFMGSSNRIRNPHLRAGLAECLESLLPHNEEEIILNPNRLGAICREQLFKQHPHASKIIPSLLDVFVDIEMTGQSVQFEQKFNYRRPMYIVMDYLWGINEYRKYFKELAKEAEQNMEAINPPLFLRFLNLLINDSVFLLDEALSNMAQLKTMQTARDSGEWAKLPLREREENENMFQHTRMIARFDNILGRWSIHTLEFLTSEITDIFSHPIMVDRIAAMLNYFLLNLVGPNKKNFKVKDKDEYDFKPDVFVMKICKIYINLKESDEFCLAVSHDGRSYSPKLFTQAEDVLGKIFFSE